MLAGAGEQHSESGWALAVTGVECVSRMAKYHLRSWHWRMSLEYEKKTFISFFSPVNQNALFKESALCRVAAELLPLKEVKESHRGGILSHSLFFF